VSGLVDRYAAPGGVGPYQPDDPAPLPPSYLEAVDAYLERVECGWPTGRARLEVLHPDAPCHTGGAYPSACTRCGGAL
jgi:hypothetical protein